MEQAPKAEMVEQGNLALPIRLAAVAAQHLLVVGMGLMAEMAVPAMHQPFLVLPLSMLVGVVEGLTLERQEKARMVEAMARCQVMLAAEQIVLAAVVVAWDRLQEMVAPADPVS